MDKTLKVTEAIVRGKGVAALKIEGKDGEKEYSIQEAVKLIESEGWVVRNSKVRGDIMGIQNAEIACDSLQSDAHKYVQGKNGVSLLKLVKTTRRNLVND